MKSDAISNFSTVSEVALITIDNVPNNSRVLSEIFNSIAQQSINVDMITQSPSYRGILNISFTIPSSDLPRAITALAKFKKEIPNLRLDIDSDNTKICVYGAGMRNIPGVAASLFTIISRNEIGVKLVTTSETDISYLVSSKDEEKAIESLKKEFGI